MFVCAVVIYDQMQVQVGRYRRIDVAQETQELLMTMTRLILREHATVGDIESCKQCGRAVSIVVVSHPLDISQAHRQHRLGAFQRLNLAFLTTHSTSALSGGFRYNPTISRSFSIKNGSVDSLKLRLRCGCTPNSDK